MLDGTLKRIRDAAGRGITGLATGFGDLDRMTCGLQRSDLVVVAGRPSMGKTALAMNIVEHALLRNGAPTIVFSLEMPAERFAMRLLASIGRIGPGRVGSARLGDGERSRLEGAVAQLREMPLEIEDLPGPTANEMRTRIRRFARERGGVGLVVVDYLQLMRGSGAAESRTIEMSGISRSLKALAVEMACPVIAVSQLNRAPKNRHDKRPVLADLGESGAIEQNADLILFVYRDEVYDADTEDRGIAELIVGKQRNGLTGSVKVRFLDTPTRFEDLVPPR